MPGSRSRRLRCRPRRRPLKLRPPTRIRPTRIRPTRIRPRPTARQPRPKSWPSNHRFQVASNCSSRRAAAALVGRSRTTVPATWC
ncbi:MAG: hypothetical protein DWQ31_06190 [Planctomycetota bacterium]|nr:MAG: hypothetical protein DWQ31_06190 [Planctomycetota bacterium]REJ98597.1 MAG: hypothetical protein DWQ35_00945 [Planctomycetota bacterium]REK29897.1 MAG: hypothetical protein DWQ42_03065 [Planctomycetota bacterium]REK47933.1 MAG: hypothetical protein DWQ46_03295 [Planctomycetota bacterium]